jgi:hypothetical protein
MTGGTGLYPFGRAETFCHRTYLMINQSKNREALLALLYDTEISRRKVRTIWIKYETAIQSSVRKTGNHFTLDRYKTSYAFLRNLTLELPTDPIPFCIVDKRCIPKPLWPLRSLIKGNRTDQRMALTIARSYETIKLPIDYSTESITEPIPNGMKVKETTQEFNKFLDLMAQKYPWYIGTIQARDSYEPRVFTTLSNGPNGPAVASAHLDAKAVVNDPVLFQNIRNLNDALRQSWITEWMVKQAESFTSKNSYITGRLGFSAEPGGKTRIFAIADYWSQTSLKVVQDSLYRTLKSLSTDATANQDKGFKSLLEEVGTKDTWCFDLSSASDRIPAVMQKYRLTLLAGQKLGDAWLGVMTERDFLIKENKTSVRWEVGQPLGLLSSFPSFALWHHDQVQFAYNIPRIRTGKPVKFFRNYRILGDDLVIFDKEVALMYQHLMSNVYGIPINKTKSVYGTNGNSQIEFTKRLALRGKEMSSISNNLLKGNNIVMMLDLIDLLLEREFISTDSDHYRSYLFLSHEEQIKFNFMFWVRSSSALPFKWDNTDLKIERDDFIIKLKEVRSENIQKQTALLDRVLMRNKSLDVYYKQSSLPCSDMALGLGSYNSDNLTLHPLVWAINQTGLDLSIALSTIWDDESPDVAPVEYLPIVSSRSFFLKPKTGRSQLLSKVILSVFKELSN